VKRFAAILLVAGCTTAPAAPIPVTGDWGGTHIGLHLGVSGGTIDYDCAAGTIEPIVPGPGGRFTAAGTHVTGFGGPEIEGQIHPTYRVRFSGRVAGERMTLEGRVENGVQLGPFALRRGAEAGIFRCL
jgi:hypothetical protein